MSDNILEAQAERVKSIELTPELILSQFKFKGSRIIDGKRIIAVQDQIPMTAKVKRTGICESGNVVLILEDESFQPVNPGCFIPILRPTYRTEVITGE